MVAQGGASERDTIVALSTAPGRGAIAVVRLSGPASGAVLARVFRPRREREAFPVRRPVLGRYVDERGEAFDEGVAILYRAPASFTGEDMAEMHGHGGTAVVEALLEACRVAGARPAAPGEFTRRAFLEGKIDLVQSESVADLVAAETRKAARAALAHLQGGLSSELEGIWERIVEAGAHLEAAIDFPDEFEPGAGPTLSGAPMGEAELAGLFAGIERDLARLEASYRSGRVLREGARVAIVGRPNAGKSTLLNRLLGAERAIMSPVPGTTRDTVEEVCDIAGIPVRLIDTAGLRETGDPVEMEGTERARRAASAADLCVMLVDGAAGAADALWARGEAGRVESPKLFAINKMDIARHVDPGAFEGLGRALRISALTGEGVDELRGAVAEALAGERAESGPGGQTLLTRERHRDLVARCRAAVGEAALATAGGVSPELVAVHLNEAQAALSELLGRDYGEALLDKIFSTFCIGK